MTCCCDADDATLPATAPAATLTADTALAAGTLVISCLPPHFDEGRGAVESHVLLILRPPLFTLFSAYLI